jgi:hypothetical protein
MVYGNFGFCVAAVDGFFANIASYRDEIHTLISGAFHFIGKQDPQAP